MIIQQQKINVEKSHSFQEKKFRIEQDQMNHMMWLTINQYEHKIRTPLQEVISNARDAHREAGNPDKPIKITLPTRLDSTFRVRDFGVGITPDRMDNVFTSFGASTKRNSNNEVGGFGIGAKSPLTYTDQFNVTTYVDGQFWAYTIHKNEEGGISCTPILEGNTDEPNGTEIQIPVKNGDEKKFIKGACRCTMFWNVQPIFNLEVEERYAITEEPLKINNRLSIFEQHQLGNIFTSSYGYSNIVLDIDGIPYQVDREFCEASKKLVDLISYQSKNIIIKLNTGEIDILQTREAIQDSEENKLVLNNICTKAINDVHAYIKNMVTSKDLLKRWNQWRLMDATFSNIKSEKFRGFTFVRNAIYLGTTIKTINYHHRAKYGGKLENTRRENETFRKFYLQEIHNLYVDDLGDSESHIIKSRRIKHFLGGNGQVILIAKADTPNKLWHRLIKNLPVKRLSTLPIPPESVTKKRQKLAKNIINIHTRKASWSYVNKNTEKINLSTNSTKFVYGDYKLRPYELEKSEFVKGLNELGYEACYIATSKIKKVENDPNFISLEDFKADLKDKVKEEWINYYVYHNIRWATYREDRQIKMVRKYYRQCKSKLIKSLCADILKPRKSYSSIFLPVVRELAQSRLKRANLIVTRIEKYHNNGGL